ncbi:hypothetical protein C8Q77DRAFT_208173 [Trametes polyzona]|nr:hypothetical protein C8Q77DRAFT_208173 [Trametes polyzona]
MGGASASNRKRKRRARSSFDAPANHTTAAARMPSIRSSVPARAATLSLPPPAPSPSPPIRPASRPATSALPTSPTRPSPRGRRRILAGHARISYQIFSASVSATLREPRDPTARAFTPPSSVPCPPLRSSARSRLLTPPFSSLSARASSTVAVRAHSRPPRSPRILSDPNDAPSPYRWAHTAVSVHEGGMPSARRRFVLARLLTCASSDTVRTRHPRRVQLSRLMSSSPPTTTRPLRPVPTPGVHPASLRLPTNSILRHGQRRGISYLRDAVPPIWIWDCSGAATIEY